MVHLLFLQSPPTTLLHKKHVVPAPRQSPFYALASFFHPKSSYAPMTSSIFQSAPVTSLRHFHQKSDALSSTGSGNAPDTSTSSPARVRPRSPYQRDAAPSFPIC